MNKKIKQNFLSLKDYPADKVIKTAKVFFVNPLKIKELEIDPTIFGIQKGSKDDLIGGDSKENAEIIKGILKGEISGPKKDIVLLNSASALYINNKVKDIESGLEIVNKTILSGNGLKKLNDLIELSNS